VGKAENRVLKRGFDILSIDCLSRRQMTPNPISPDRIMQFAWAFAPALTIEVATRNRVFEFLDTESHTAEEVAEYAKGSTRGWRAVLNCLVGVGLLAKESFRYSTTPESSMYLIATKPSYMGGFFKHISKQLIPNWLNLEEIVRTGKPTGRVNDQAGGEEFFAEFVNDLFPISYPAANALGEHLNLRETTSEVRVLDVAAGSGVWGIALAHQSEHVKVTAVDWPLVLEVTRQMSARFGLTSRFDFLAGDLLEVEFPDSCDVATLGHILHSEGERRSQALLKKVSNALKPGGTIAIAEFTPNSDRTGPPQSLIFAINMLVNTDEGDTYPFEQVVSWLEEAGFVNARELPSAGPAPLILANRRSI
jgi:SAM-dependent methyltransferase